MLESFFLTVNQWIAGGTAIAAVGCFIWGMISVVFSPCHLASMPWRRRMRIVSIFRKPR